MFLIKDFSSNCDQIRRKLRIWPLSLEKSLMENFILCAVYKFIPRCIQDIANLPLQNFLQKQLTTKNRAFLDTSCLQYLMQCPFCLFSVFPHSKNLKLACCLKGFHLRIALSLQKYALFIHTLEMPYLAKIYPEPFPVFAKSYIIDQ